MFEVLYIYGKKLFNSQIKLFSPRIIHLPKHIKIGILCTLFYGNHLNRQLINFQYVNTWSIIANLNIEGD